MFTKDHGNGRIQLVEPVVMRKQLLPSYHDSVLSRHQGKSQMLNAISKNYFWRGMVKDTKYYVNNCEACLSVKMMKAGIVPRMHHYIPKFFSHKAAS